MGPRFESVKAHHPNWRCVLHTASREPLSRLHLLGRNEFARHQGFALQNACDAAKAAKEKWPVGQAVKTAASHAANMGSIPVRVTI